MTMSGPEATAPESQEAVIARHRHLVRYVVDRLRVSVGGVFDDDDAMQVGMLGLVNAQATYRADRGASFETYAILRIRGAVLDAVRALDPLGRQGRDASRLIANTVDTLTMKLGREPTDAETADELGLTVERCVELRRVAATRMVSLDTDADGPSDHLAGVGDAIVDQHAVDPGEISTRREELTDLMRQVAQLGDRNRRVIALYYRDELTFREIARVLGVSESRACQIHRSALDVLRGRLTWPAADQPVLT